MSKRLEHFIEDNRREFDSAVPSADVWSNIETAITGEKKKKNVLTPIIKWSLAAAAVLLVSISAYYLVTTKPGKTELTSIPPDTLPVFAEMPEVKPFIHMIAMKQEELKTLSKEQPELYQQFTKDITQLDSSYQALKNQVSVTPNREMLLEAMIHNLQLQLDVLNQQLNIIQQIKQKKYSHEQVI